MNGRHMVRVRVRQSLLAVLAFGIVLVISGCTLTDNVGAAARVGDTWIADDEVRQLYQGSNELSSLTNDQVTVLDSHAQAVSFAIEGVLFDRYAKGEQVEVTQDEVNQEYHALRGNLHSRYKLDQSTELPPAANAVVLKLARLNAVQKKDAQAKGTTVDNPFYMQYFQQKISELIPGTKFDINPRYGRFSYQEGFTAQLGGGLSTPNTPTPTAERLPSTASQVPFDQQIPDQQVPEQQVPDQQRETPAPVEPLPTPQS